MNTRLNRIALVVWALLVCQVAAAQPLGTPSNTPQCAVTSLVSNYGCGPELDIIGRLVLPVVYSGQGAYFAAFEPAGVMAWRLSVSGPVERIARNPPVPYVHEHFAWLCPAEGRLYITAVFNPALLQRAIVLARDDTDKQLWRYLPQADYPIRALACH